MGSNFDYGWSDINQAFAAGKVGMYVSGSDVYTNLVQASNIDPSIYGVTTIPLGQEQERRRARRRHARRGPARRQRRPRTRRRSSGSTSTTSSRWSTRRRRSATRRRSVASKQPVGVPALPVFNKAQYDLANTWIKPYINVPLAQMKPFTNGIFTQKLIPEPEASTQSVYHSLDAVVEAVLTNQNANIPSCCSRRTAPRRARSSRERKRQLGRSAARRRAATAEPSRTGRSRRPDGDASIP